MKNDLSLHLFLLELLGLVGKLVPCYLSLIHCIAEILVLFRVGLMDLLIELDLLVIAPIISELGFDYLCSPLLPSAACIGLVPFICEQIIQKIIILWSWGLQSVEVSSLSSIWRLG